jgi:hypothetical protein
MTRPKPTHVNSTTTDQAVRDVISYFRNGFEPEYFIIEDIMPQIETLVKAAERLIDVEFALAGAEKFIKEQAEERQELRENGYKEYEYMIKCRDEENQSLRQRVKVLEGALKRIHEPSVDGKCQAQIAQEALQQGEG